MSSTRRLSSKKNLLLAFDAFGTLFEPNVPVPQAYGRAALRHGISCVDKPEHELVPQDYKPVKESFYRAFKTESARNPNYGRATGLGAEKWWANVIHGTFEPFLRPSQQVPNALVSELLTRYTTKEGYDLFPDVLPFFRMLKNRKLQTPTASTWKWNKTVVGIITNSDDRVPSVLESFGLKMSSRRVGSSIHTAAKATGDVDMDFVVLSYDVGHEKPHRRMFEAAEIMLKDILAETEGDVKDGDSGTYEKLYVGDEFEKDYLAAKAAGWHAVLLKRNFEEDLPVEAPLTNIDADNLIRKHKGNRVDVCTSLEALERWDPKTE